MSAAEGTIREEAPDDHAAVRDLLIDAFQRPEESVLVDRLRAEHADAFGPALVAEIEGHLVGYVCCSELRIEGTPGALALGPIAVLPARQMMGIGSALMRRIQEVVTVPVALLGEPVWYRRFGFRPAAELGIQPPWDGVGDAWQVWFPASVDAERYRGKARYLPPFDEV